MVENRFRTEHTPRSPSLIGVTRAIFAKDPQARQQELRTLHIGLKRAINQFLHFARHNNLETITKVLQEAENNPDGELSIKPTLVYINANTTYNQEMEVLTRLNYVVMVEEMLSGRDAIPYYDSILAIGHLQGAQDGITIYNGAIDEVYPGARYTSYIFKEPMGVDNDNTIILKNTKTRGFFRRRRKDTDWYHGVAYIASGDPEASNIGLDYAKTEKDERKQDYENGLQQAIDTYAILRGAFRYGRETTIQAAMRLLSGYDIDISLVDNAERSLFVLAIADEWLATNSISEKMRLLDVLALVATQAINSIDMDTMSGRIRRLSEKGSPRGAMVDPQFTRRSSDKMILSQLDAYNSFLGEYISLYIDREATEKVKAMLTDYSEGSKLYEVRKKLKIASHQEKPFDVLVLTQTAQQMRADIGFDAMEAMINMVPTMVINSDWEEYDPLEHEYAHTQGGISEGYYRGLLFRGGNEALTENTRLHPASYPVQRAFLNYQLFSQHPEYESLLYDAYRGDDNARVSIFAGLIQNYGLKGFLRFARIAPIENQKLSGGLWQSIFVDPHW